MLLFIVKFSIIKNTYAETRLKNKPSVFISAICGKPIPRRGILLRLPRNLRANQQKQS